MNFIPSEHGVNPLNGIVKPIPVDREVVWDKTKTLISKTDEFGNIEYANDAFIEVSSYEDYELMSKPHSIIRHPDMPKAIFNILWKHLKDGKNFHAIIKNLSKTGRYYWVITNFEIIKDDSGKITNYMGYRKAVPESVIKDHIAPIYQRLLKIEEVSGEEASVKYFKGLLEEKKKTYMEYITELLDNAKDSDIILGDNDKEKDSTKGNSQEDVKEGKKGFFAKLFG